MINRKRFFDTVRADFGSLSQSQVDGINAILDYWDNHTELFDGRWLAYILATVWHETGAKMQPVEEIGKGKGRPYGQKIKHSGVRYTLPDKLYYGRGDVQLTWYENYELMGRLLGYDLLNHPELMLDLKISVEVLFEGMTKGSSSFGDFTGKCLEMYFNDDIEDPFNARKIINSLDRAVLIEEYYWIFKKAILG